MTPVTLGIGCIFVPYRNWAFVVRPAAAYGEVTRDALTQSTTREPDQGVVMPALSRHPTWGR